MTKPTPDGWIKLPPVDPRPPEIALGEAIANAWPEDDDIEEIDIGGGDAPDSFRWVMVDVFRRAARLLRQGGHDVGVYALWRLTGKRNPARQDGSRSAGEAVALRMTKTERASRAAAGGRALFHGGKDGYDPGHARIIARRLQRLQAATRRGEHKPKKKNRLDVSRSKLRGSGD